MKNVNLIKCPYCGCEYLPGEIYLPDEFLGQPKNVERNLDGKIDTFAGVEQKLTEKFSCYNCNKTFSCTAMIKYVVLKSDEDDFDTDFETPLYKNRISLEE